MGQSLREHACDGHKKCSGKDEPTTCASSHSCGTLVGVTPDPQKLRGRAKRALRQYFEKRRSPRSMLAIVILLTGLAGFGSSFGLLRSGLHLMSVRYPLSVFGAYGIFLVLIRLWVEVERRHFDSEAEEIKSALEKEDGPEPSDIRVSDSSWWDWLNISPDFGFDEGCLPVILIGAILGLLGLFVSAIDAAPLLIAEVFVDVALVGLLYRRLSAAAREHWLGTAIRKTWLHVLGTALLLSIVGACLDVMAPQSDSMGKAIREMYRQGHPKK